MPFRKSLVLIHLSKLLVTTVIFFVFVTTASAQSSTYGHHIHRLLSNNINKWIYNPVIINSIKAQNAKHITLSQDDIDYLDQKWRTERKSNAQPLIDSVLANPLSAFLKKIKAENQGLFSEIFIMDNRGLNVGQSDVTSDYWQGDEAKWKKTYAVGPDALVIGAREYDRSSQKFLIQVSVSVVDPASNTTIGAATIGVSLVQLIRAGAVAERTQ